MVFYILSKQALLGALSSAQARSDWVSSSRSNLEHAVLELTSPKLSYPKRKLTTPQMTLLRTLSSQARER